MSSNQTSYTNLFLAPQRRLTSLTSLIVGAAVAVIVGGMFSSDAEAQTFKRRLSNRGALRIQASGCQLRLVSPSDVTARLRVRCEGSGPNFRGRLVSGLQLLRRGQQAAITANSCFLTRTRTNLKRIDVRCGAQPPATATPTVTPSPTLTPTITPTPTATPTSNANLLLSNSQIAAFNVANPIGVETPRAVTGIATGETLVAIDRRPQNGILYGLGYNSAAFTLQLYAINSDTSVATAIGTTGSFVAADGVTVVPVGTGAATRFGMDFNPTVDRIRVVTSDGLTGNGGQNFRINPNTGAFVDGDLGGATGSVTGLNMDGGINVAGTPSSVQETAYTNNVASTTITTQYTLDAGTDALCIQNPPNAGTQTVCQTLTSTVSSVAGFDIAPGVNATTSNTAVTAGNGLGVVTLTGAVTQSFATINLANGALSGAITIPSTVGTVLGFSVLEPTGVSMVALNAAGTTLLRFNSATPGTTTSIAITGVAASEVLVGMDYRPATGQLFALGVDSAADAGTLYRLDPQTAVATAIGATGSVAFVDAVAATIDLPGTSVGYGVAFNPTVDRIRVVTGSGLNFRLNPNNGLPVDTDTNAAGNQPDGTLNGATTSADEAAYTNATGGQTLTTLFVLDSASDALYIQNPPNNGTETVQKVITLNGNTLDFTNATGFKIRPEVRVTASNTVPAAGTGFAILTVAGVTSLYSIDLVSGVATNLGTVADGTVPMTGLAIAVTRIN